MNPAGIAGGRAAAGPVLPVRGGLDRVALALVVAGLLALYVPLLWDWSAGAWSIETQGHELLVMAIAAWLVWRRREELLALPDRPALLATTLVFAAALGCYLLGRLLGVFRLELLSIILLPAALVLCFKGWAGLRTIWFALFFLLFTVPLPFSLVLTITGPMKTAVSAVGVQLLQWVGYPVGRTGVIITIGQYQLLVNEACAGLQTMFVLEAMGLLYTNLMNHQSLLRNALLAVLVVPVAFLANVVRVVSLTLITYHFGDAAGQGFLHGFAGMVLFMVALVLVIAVDGLLGRVLPTPREAR
ncbi:exosortase B [Piscinibacter defluvii]|uniref:exosortase B n=1 Tax=Piscinibacter defluvii TaxID=1796922 RepID=UPI001F0B8E56|nr:exosortase B [Piscinibacter defluvii]